MTKIGQVSRWFTITEIGEPRLVKILRLCYMNREVAQHPFPLNRTLMKYNWVLVNSCGHPVYLFTWLLDLSDLPC